MQGNSHKDTSRQRWRNQRHRETERDTGRLKGEKTQVEVKIAGDRATRGEMQQSRNSERLAAGERDDQDQRYGKRENLGGKRDKEIQDSWKE